MKPARGLEMRLGPQSRLLACLLLASSVPPAPAGGDDPGREPTAVAEPAASPDVELEFVPQQSVAEAGSIGRSMLARPVEIRLIDARDVSEPSLLGERTAEDGRAQPLRATTDVAPFVQGVLEQLAASWGIRVEAGAELVIGARLKAFKLLETAETAGAKFVAEVRMEIELADRTGRALWRGSSYGDSTHQGKRFDAGDCNKALSDALREMWAAALGHPELPKAWAGEPAATKPSSPG
jgi:hypothetical protein